jgi:hypothetical protein
MVEMGEVLDKVVRVARAAEAVKAVVGAAFLPEVR